MFTNALYFIIVFSLFSFSDQDAAPVLPPLATLGAILAGYAAFFLVVKHRFDRLEKAYLTGATGSFASRHGACIGRCMLLSIIAWAFFIYILGLKSLLLPLRQFADSYVAQSATAVALFFVFLVLIWRCAFASHRRFCNPSSTLRGYLASHIRFNSALIAPWLIFSAVFDAARLLPQEVIALLNASPLAEYGFMVFAFIILGVFFPPLLVRLWACKPLAPGPVRDRLERFCTNAGFACADMLAWDLFEGKLITAGVLGFVAKFRYLLISPALLDLLDDRELEAVVAHEIGHVKHRHMLFYLLFILGYALFAYIFFTVFFYLFLSYDGIFNAVISADGRPGTALSCFSMLLLVTLLLLYFRGLFGVFSRNFERQADGFACRYTGSATGIIASLDKIAVAGSQSRTAPNWHHYSIQQRIEFMQRCEADPLLVKQHDRKVGRLIAQYCLAFVLLGGLYAGFGDSFIKGSELSVLQKITQRRIDADPENPALHFMLANVSFEKKDYGRAVRDYQETLRLAPDYAEALNNLAWLYATAQDPAWRNSSEALRLSRRAAELDPKPHILDTLAESYFLNGDVPSALDAINRALAQNPQDPSYYEKQREKFLKLLRESGKQEDTVIEFPMYQDTPGVSI
ncbi:MAG: M48 family metalloprotease [Deltaproteobacteria bacterium]|nr:M48 family metalloprotease [Deltaproteobacteria bacterium]